MSAPSPLPFGLQIEIEPPADQPAGRFALNGTTIWRANLPVRGGQGEAAAPAGSQDQKAPRETIDLDRLLGGLAFSAVFQPPEETPPAAQPQKPASGEVAPAPKIPVPVRAAPNKPAGGLLTQALPDLWRSAQEFLTSLTRLQQMIGQTASIETAVAGKTVARSVITWSGDIDTFLSPQASPEVLAQHMRSVDLFLIVRLTNLRRWTILAGLIKKASALSSAPYALLMLVKSIQTELKDLLA